MSDTGNPLKSALWQAANVLRGSAVDRTDWKGYILPLLFFKRISDVWDEETAEAREIYGDADPSHFPEVHRFVLPDGCHWNDIRQVAANVGAALQKAMQEIERTNPNTLFRVFGSADWGNKEKFADELLKDLIEGFSEIRLGNAAVSTDVLGDAYEYLVGKFADVTRRNKAGEFYTPRSVVRMMVEILDPKEGESIYDPACGTGGMLLGAIEHVTRKGGDPRTFYGKIYGQEKNLTTSAIARMNLVLHGIEDFQVTREDTLRNPTFTDPSTGGLANPKFKALGERLEDLKNRHQQGLLLSIDFLKELLALAKDVVRTERETPEEEDIDRGKAALTALFEEARTGDTPVMVKRVVDDIDEIVRAVRFDGWQATHAGEREVKKALRQTLFRYKLHQDADLFEKAYGYIREYY